ncbi:MAG: hypothetical protein ACFB10_10290 [Salibacteraceae bacterium]
MKHLLFSVFLLLLSGFSWGQYATGNRTSTFPGWSLNSSRQIMARSTSPYWLQADSTKKGCSEACGAQGCLLNTKVLASFDTRFSQFEGEFVRLNGFRLGLDVAKAFRFGVSGYWQRRKIDLDPIAMDPPLQDTLLTFNFQYFAFFSEFILYQDFKWELSLPIAFGVGPRVFEYRINEDGPVLRKDSRDIGLATISVDGHFRVVPWVALGAGFGYRHAFVNESETRDIINEPIYSIKLKFLVGNFVKFMFFRYKLEEERDAYIKEREARRQARQK